MILVPKARLSDWQQSWSGSCRFCRKRDSVENGSGSEEASGGSDLEEIDSGEESSDVEDLTGEFDDADDIMCDSSVHYADGARQF